MSCSVGVNTAITKTFVHNCESGVTTEIEREARHPFGKWFDDWMNEPDLYGPDDGEPVKPSE